MQPGKDRRTWYLLTQEDCAFLLETEILKLVVLSNSRYQAQQFILRDLMK